MIRRYCLRYWYPVSSPTRRHICATNETLENVFFHGIAPLDIPSTTVMKVSRVKRMTLASLREGDTPFQDGLRGGRGGIMQYIHLTVEPWEDHSFLNAHCHD